MIAGSTLLRDGKVKGAQMNVTCHETLIKFMWYMVVICTCSAASPNSGSMKIHTDIRRVQPGVVLLSWQ